MLKKIEQKDLLRVLPNCMKRHILVLKVVLEYGDSFATRARTSSGALERMTNPFGLRIVESFVNTQSAKPLQDPIFTGLSKIA